MGYDLIARNNKAEDMYIGSFSWPILLQETGAGYVIGYGKGLQPSSYVYQNNQPGSPVSNDGYKVTANEAKSMAAVVRGYISVKTFVNKEWDEMNEEDRKNRESWNETEKIYTEYTSEKTLDQLNSLAEFLENCSGFRIY